MTKLAPGTYHRSASHSLLGAVTLVEVLDDTRAVVLTDVATPNPSAIPGLHTPVANVMLADLTFTESK